MNMLTQTHAAPKPSTGPITYDVVMRPVHSVSSSLRHRTNAAPTNEGAGGQLCDSASLRQNTKTILGQIAKYMYLCLCVFTYCVFLFLGTLQYHIVRQFLCEPPNIP